MTEDDTFKKLSRISYDELLKLFSKQKDVSLLNFIYGNGWTYEEFDAEQTRLHKLKLKTQRYP